MKFRAAYLAIPAALILLIPIAWFLLTPTSGNLSVQVSASTANKLAAGSVAIKGANGWHTLGAYPTRLVPRAPDTVTVANNRLPIGHYEGLRLNGYP